MRYPPHILDEIRARLPVSQVVAKKVALKKKGREFAGLSPFKTEKTPSFFVNDQKAFYHCFASGEHGDIFTFVMKTEGLNFPEAVERLAADAGVELPKPTARDQAREDQRERLFRLLELSTEFFQKNLRSPSGRQARDYLAGRELDAATLAEFRIGYAPQSRSALKEHLASTGFTNEEMSLSGMLIAGEDISVPYDRFRHRIMFPIQDAKGRVIAFGGRALDPDQPAKYLNSPETPVFHKGHVLFNAHRARPAAFDTSRIIAVEGYMDVIALHQAGFHEAVAPLGTALTSDQIQLLWRLAPEPILCFDGDSAGRRAAHRAIDTVLPNLKPGSSLRFAFLPDGLDPDDLIRQDGADAVKHVLKRAAPLADILFEREWGAGDWVTPERRAKLEQRLHELTSSIAEMTVRNHYQRDMRRRLYEAWSQQQPKKQHQSIKASAFTRNRNVARTSRGGSFQAQPSQTAPSAALKQSPLVAGTAVLPPPREALLVLAVLNHPWLLDDHAEEFAALTLASKPLNDLRDAILVQQASDNSLDTSPLRSQLTQAGAGGLIGSVERAITHRCDKFADPDAEPSEVEAGWCHALRIHTRHVELRKALAAATREFDRDGSEASWARICEIKDLLAAGEEPEAHYGMDLPTQASGL